MKKLKFVSIRYKFTLFFIGTVFIPILLISAISYTLFFSTVGEKISTSNYNSIIQIGSHIEFVLNDVQQLSLDLFRDKDLRNILNYENTTDTDINIMINNYEVAMRNIIASNKYVHSVYIETNSDLFINPVTTNDNISDEIKAIIKPLKGRYYWTSDLFSRYGEEIPSLSLVRTIRDVIDFNKDIGTLKINIDENTISDIYKNNSIDPTSEVFIVTSSGKIISTLNKDSLYTQFNANIFNKIKITPKKSDYFVIKDELEKTLLTYYHIENTDWYIVNTVSLNNLLKSSRDVYIKILFGILLSFFFFTISTLIFIHRLLKPLNEVATVMKEVENENFQVQLDIRGNDEITLLGKNFNRMSRKLNELMHEVYLVKLKQKDAELQALQAQINPHFLYNTLDTIYWMSCMENAQETSVLVKALGKLFRLSLNHGNEKTTVSREIEHLRNYILIQQKRYDGIIEFSIDVDEATLSSIAIKLILQPLVENAIYHGIEPKGEFGTIQISVYKEKNDLIYKVTDNGVGTNEEDINTLLAMGYETNDKKHGIALKNVNDRIKLRYGSYYGIKFQSTQGSGTTVIITQPYLEGAHT